MIMKKSVFLFLTGISSVHATDSRAIVTNTQSIFQASIVEMQTNLGTIAVQLNWQKAPISSQNFMNYVTSDFYKNTFFHRVYNNQNAIKVVQGGGFDVVTGKQKKTSTPIVNEAQNGLHNTIGTIAMARTNDPNSATSQFFFNVTDNSSYWDATATNSGYAVFGDVIKGMSVINKISNAPVYNELPFLNSQLITIDSVYTSIDSNDFKIPRVRLSIVGSGKITSLPTGIDCNKNCSINSKTISTWKKLTLTAKPSAGYAFAGWRGDCQGSKTSISFDATITTYNCTATFSKS